MKLFELTISIVLLAALVLPEQRYLDHVSVKSVPFMVRRESPYTISQILNKKRVFVERDDMNDPIFRDSLVALLKPYFMDTIPSRKDSFDVRMVCLIYWKIDSREKVDTLSFGWVGMAYNDNYYDVDIPLLRFLTSKLPSDYIYHTEQFIEMFPKGR